MNTSDERPPNTYCKEAELLTLCQGIGIKWPVGRDHERPDRTYWHMIAEKLA